MVELLTKLDLNKLLNCVNYDKFETSGDYIYFMGKEDNECIHLDIRIKNNNPIMYFFYIDQSTKNEGKGTKFMNEFINIMREKNYSKIHIHNCIAPGFFKKFGYDLKEKYILL